MLKREQSQRPWPAANTIGEMLAREGLVVPRKKRRRTPSYTQPFVWADAPNRVWCADFKGWFRAGDGERIDPLTITNACSGYLVRCQQVEKTDRERVRAIFDSAFREYGPPEAIRRRVWNPSRAAAAGVASEGNDAVRTGQAVFAGAFCDRIQSALSGPGLAVG
jgi:transposase InsO family protein